MFYDLMGFQFLAGKNETALPAAQGDIAAESFGGKVILTMNMKYELTQEQAEYLRSVLAGQNYTQLPQPYISHQIAWILIQYDIETRSEFFHQLDVSIADTAHYDRLHP